MRIILLLLTTFFISCKKDEYKSVSGEVNLTGYVYLTDTIAFNPSIPQPGLKIFLNSGSDSSVYIYQATTDSGGKYSIPFLQQGKDYILFTRYVKNGFEYEGVKKVTSTTENVIYSDLHVHSKFSNGISLLFTDSLNGPLPHLPFRLYTSRIAAQFDSVAYAVVNTSSDGNARYSKVNIAPGKYYTVSSQMIGPSTMRVFDSVVVTSNELSRKILVLR